MDWLEVDRQIKEGLIVRQKHPTADLTIYNYTARAAYERVWTPESMACRGLIADSTGRIRARPFPKFHNLDEHLAMGGTIPDEPFEVYEKLDGSLGILYWLVEGSKYVPHLATRGSFTSEQARRGGAILRERYGHLYFSTHLTYLFEIIYPENRIVVNYGDKADIVLLTVIETQSGHERPDIVDILAKDGLPVVTRHEGIAAVDQLRAMDERNREGYVIRFASGLRLKVKMAEYVRLHRLLTGVTSRVIWEYLKDKRDLGEILDRVPDEFNQWVRDTIDRLRLNYEEVESYCRSVFKDLGDRKATAAYFQTCGHRSVLFLMLDGKDYSDAIWKAIKPGAERAFYQVREETA